MTTLTFDRARPAPHVDPWQQIRAAVFWGFILLVIVSPAVLSALVLLKT